MSIIDAVVTNTQGQEVGQYSGETLEQIQARYPGALVGDSDEVTKAREDQLRTAPAPCTHEQFWYALECLPPMGWRNAGNGESFKMSERLSGRMTRIYARTGQRYWSFVDTDDLNHAQIMARVCAVDREEVAA